MRANLTKFLCGLSLAAALTGPAAAEERLVMPFACRAEGGQVQLAPSAPQAYQIYGTAEHKRLTTCSPYNPRKCHNWSIHRFDLDCGGARTSWHAVVAALTPMLAESLGAPGDAEQAYGPQGQARPYRLAPSRPIAFPPGFAPNPMGIARFARPAPAVADIPLPPKKPEAAALPEVAAADPSPKPAPAKPKATQQAEHRALTIEVDPAMTGSLPKSGSLWRDASLVFALMLAALLALSATLLLRRRKLQALPAPIARPLARMSQSGLGRAAPHQQREAPATRLRLWDEDWLPATMTEALDVLGVDPHASQDRMKTTVTRLRRALHPDYALDDEDRRLRERRLKQINVAWEIVSGKRRAPWLALKARRTGAHG